MKLEAASLLTTIQAKDEEIAAGVATSTKLKEEKSELQAMVRQ